MGCGGSKPLDHESEAIPAKLRPLLRRRYEEIKEKHRNIAPGGPKDTTSLSRKELLNKDNDINDTINDNDVIDDGRSQSFEEENLKVVPGTQEMIRTEKGEITEMAAEEAKVELAVPKLPSPPTNQAECNDRIDVSLQQKSVNADEAIVSVDGEEKEEEKEDSGGEEGINRMEEIHFGPASPSFREYLPETNDEEENDDYDNEGTYKDGEVNTVLQCRDDEANKKSESESIHETAESMNSDEGSVTKVIKKRGKKGMKFKRVLPKPKARAMKNLLNVKSCYYPACSGHDNTRLLEQKAAA